MHLGEIGRGGWLRAAGAGLLCALVAAEFTSSFPLGPLVVLLVGAGVGIVVTALAVAVWARTGGYAAHRALWEWVRGGPEPVGVSTRRRVRWLSGFIDRTGWYGWLGLALAVVFALSGASDLLGTPEWRDALLALVPAALWAGVSVRTFAFDRRHLPRARELYQEELRTAMWTDLPPF